MLPFTAGARPGKINMMSLPNSANSRLLPERKPSPTPTSSSNDPTPQAMPNMVRNERSLCPQRLRRICAKMSETVRITGIHSTFRTVAGSTSYYVGPGELLDANIPVIRRFSNTPIASEVVNREPTAKSGKANSEKPQPPSLILTLHRLLLRSWQRLRRLARFRWCCLRNRRRLGSSHNHRPSSDFNRSLFAVHHQARAVRSDRAAGARLIVVIVSFDLFEVALDLSLARARLNPDRHVSLNRNR